MSVPSHIDSYYAASANDKKVRPKLEGEHRCDVCVVGAGFTGISTALSLAERGKRVVVLEGTRIGFGASGRNGGQIVNSFNRDIDYITRTYGEDIGQKMGKMAFAGSELIRERIEKYNIDCDLKHGNVFAACNKKQFEDLKSKKALWEAHGHNELELLSASSIQDHIGSDRYAGGLLDRKGGHIQPLNLVLGQAQALESLGGIIFEDSKAIRIEQGKPAKVVTEHGVVVADTVVVAGNAYLLGLIPEVEKKAMPCGTQMVATEVLSEELQKQLLPTGYCVEDCNYLLDYFRLSGDGRLIYGGGTSYGAREPGKIEQLIVPKMLKTFPYLKGVKIDFEWTGNFLLTLLRMPQVGCIGDNLFYAQGYSGHGVTNSHLMGVILADAIEGDRERYDVFASMPQYPFPGGRMLRVPYTAIGASYYIMRDKLGI
ncbi:NAD(P)/FAD-dependent oxidoreductase [Marinomonas mediterranea]|uniref:FAD dependent oxidoreductase n=1 Tax=Marinomonas mediterranea (strain ATCC 700492 / JCM 21426 / NBRC 103028 / MMB-1) TaxID=717774 RepID=F2JWY1_MARM1|nr:FAD-binding oxidoreductase [Marinomonas mediterranea]ADZ92998.1 FAD dependent oxidoreductase [Marinomonas mediterranea MMB-1]WCN19016.1 FAD-dependent oxidoreductase [Marinomonas mediterranea MMB-1]